MEQTDFLGYLISSVGGVLLILLGVLGYFLKVVHTDVRKNTLEVGKNKGRYDVLDQKLNSETERLRQENIHQNQLTQMALENLTKTVDNLIQKVNFTQKE